MLTLHKLPLKDFDRLLRKRGKDSKGARQPSLAKPAVADRTNGRFAMHNVSNGAAGATTRMGFVHHFLLERGKGHP